MTLLRDVLKELFKMFLADLRLTGATLGGIGLVALLMRLERIGPVAAGALLAGLSVAVLAEAVLREARQRRREPRERNF